LLRKRPDVWICDQYICWRDYCFEAARRQKIAKRRTFARYSPICLRNYSALIALPANHHYRLVFILIHVGKGRVTLHEHARVNGHVQLAAQIGHALRLVFSTAIGEEDEWDALCLEIRKGLVSARQRI
jgi:hypothetical protein